MQNDPGDHGRMLEYGAAPAPARFAVAYPAVLRSGFALSSWDIKKDMYFY